MPRKIIHIDMDCFYAAVEMRDNPELKKVPLAIGGDGPRSVLCTSNYLARKFGVKSAMSTVIAKRLCPGLVIVRGDMTKYKTVSQEIHSIFGEYTDKIQPIGWDEAYLDVSNNKDFHGSATLLAKDLKKRIFEKTQLTASAGVAPNKFLAKIASDWRKPDGLFVITPEKIDSFIRELPVKKINGVGKVTASKLYDLGITKCSDIQKYPQEKLMKYFGKYGKRLYELSFGKDNSEVVVSRDRKSLSVENTFYEDLMDPPQMLLKMEKLYEEFKVRYLRYQAKEESDQVPKDLFVKLKFNDFKSVTAQTLWSWDIRIDLIKFQDLREELERLLLIAYERGKRPVRLLGLGVHLDHGPNQLRLL